MKQFSLRRLPRDVTLVEQILFISADPCFATPCKVPYARCISVRGRAICGCKTDCPRTADPVCGSDYKTYENNCMMKKASCQRRVRITVRTQGRCIGK